MLQKNGTHVLPQSGTLKNVISGFIADIKLLLDFVYLGYFPTLG